MNISFSCVTRPFAFILCQFLLLQLQLFGQGVWKQQSPLPTGENIQDIFCLPNSSLSWAVGNSGIILKTLDGIKWVDVYSGVAPASLNSVFFVNENTGWTAGDNGIILKTTNGGTNWDLQDNSSTYDIKSIFFIDASNGWAACNSGTILSTTNGGSTWKSKVIHYADLNSIYFIDNNTGYCSGHFGLMMKSTDGGKSWTDQLFKPKDVCFVDNYVGWAVGPNGLILKTVDSGDTWDIKTSPTIVDLNSVYSPDANSGWAVGNAGIMITSSNGGSTWNTQTTGVTQNLYGLYFKDPQKGWAVGASGRIIYTNNGGSNWNARYSPVVSTLNSVHFADAQNGWAVGNSGLVIKSTDGGNSWISQSSTTSQTLRGVHFTSTNNGWAVGNSGTIIETSNGGTTWQVKYSNPAIILRSVFFANPNSGWAVGTSGTIMATSNGGNTWAAKQSGTFNPLSSVFFTDPFNGWAIGENSTFLSTTNGGETWKVNQDGAALSINKVSFTDFNNGMAVGDAGIVLNTTNGGKNWYSKQLNKNIYFNDFSFIDANNGWIVGSYGTIFQTSTGGSTWYSIQLADINQEFYCTASNSTNSGWIAGDKGMMIKTTNKGVSWSTQAGLRGIDIKSIKFIDENTGWAIGSNSTILRTTDGGTNWKVQKSNEGLPLEDVFPLDANNCFVVGSIYCLNTSDGGDSWSFSSLSPISNLYDLYFSDKNNGWVTGNQGRYANTTNTGTTWAFYKLDTNNDLFSINFADANSGWVVGATGTIYTTSNGGNNWVAQISNTTKNLNGVFFINAYTGWAVGNSGTVITTTNGGNTWVTKSIGSTIGLNDVFFTNENNGWIVGMGGLIFKTTDGGSIWTKQQETGIYDDLYSIYFTAANKGWVGGSDVLISNYTDFSPNTQAFNINATEITEESITLNWKRGNGNQCALFAKQTTSGTCKPVGNMFYLPDPFFEWGDEIDNTGWFCVYNGTGDSTTIEGLDASKQYTFQLFEYNMSPDFEVVHYNKLVSSDNPKTFSTLIASPVIDIQPENKSLCEGSTAKINVKATGEQMTFQWQGKITGYDWENLEGSITYINCSAYNTTSLELNIIDLKNNLNGAQYRCIISNSSGSVLTNEITLTVNPKPSAAGAITGISQICKGQNGLEFSVQDITGANNYTWALPAGIIGTSTSKSITCNIGSTALSGNITVQGENTCGTGPSSEFTVVINDIPGNAGSITGLQEVCKGQTGVIYSIADVNAATSYIWSLPSGSTIVSGDNSKSIVLSFGNAAISGQVKVKPHNLCGDGGESAVLVNVNTIPGNADIISGNNSVCQGATGVSYSILPVSGATSYMWISPANSTISNSSSYQIFVNYGANSISGNLTVKGHNFCGDGLESTLPVTVIKAPADAGPITGITTVCKNRNGLTYTVSTITDATSYIWTLPSGFNGAGTGNSLIVNTGSTAVNGEIKVKGTNICFAGKESALSITVNDIPNASGEITGPVTICKGQSDVLYSVGDANGASSYIWTLPANVSGNSTSKSILVNFDNSAQSGQIKVKPSNTCGEGAESVLNFIANSKPENAGIIIGTTSVCKGQDNISYSVSSINGAGSYIWTLPPNSAGTSTTNTITINYPSNSVSGDIKVKGTNQCGNGGESILPVSVNSIPSAAGNITGSASVCKNQNNVSYTITSISDASSYIWTLPAGSSGNSSTNTILVNFGNIANSGNITIKGHNSCGDGAVSSYAITVNDVPADAGTITGINSVCQGQNNVLYSITDIIGASSYIWTYPSGVSGNSTYKSILLNFDKNSVSGDITVRGNNQCGEGRFAKFNVQVDIPPDVAKIDYSGMAKVCPGDSLRLEVASNSNYKYSWKLDNVKLPSAANFVYAKQNGLYSVDVSAGSCISSSLQQYIEYRAGYPKPALYVKGPVVWYFGCSNTSAKEYNWYYKGQKIPNANGYIYVANKNHGCYLVRIHDGNGCWVPSDSVCTTAQQLVQNAMPADYNITIPTSNLEQPNSLTVFPNPAKGKFTIKLTDDFLGDITIIVKDLAGRVIKEEKDIKTLDIYQKEMMLGENTKGFYLIEIIMGAKRQMIKVVME